jgi:outer membrane receptor protein involved in Fe transport
VDDGDTNYSDDFRPPFRNGYYVAAKTLSFYIMDEFRFLDEQATLVPGLRYMSYQGISGPSGQVELIPDIDMSGWAPSLKLTYTYGAQNLIYVSAARALRMPTPPEHYWHYDPDDAGVDTSQLPFNQEDGFMLQAGWRFVLPTRTRIELSPYFYDIRDYIRFDLINFVSYNIEKARIYGIEFEIAHQFRGGWSTFFNYTYQQSRTEGDPFIELFVHPDDKDFDRIPGLPAHRANFGLQYRAPTKASVSLFLLAVSSQDVIYNNNRLWNDELRVRRQDAYVKLDIEGRYPLGGFVEVGLFARNILDARYFERFGFPAAPRHIGISFKALF